MIDRRIGCVVLLASGMQLGSVPVAQTLAPKPSPVQYVTVASTSPTEAVAPGSSTTVSVEVTPKPNIHVYASGAKGFTPVALIVSPGHAIEPGTAKYPAPELQLSPGSDGPVPVYTKPFRIVQPIKIGKSAKSGEMLNVTGAVNYESCDDRMCYPLLSIPVAWTLTVK